MKLNIWFERLYRWSQSPAIIAVAVFIVLLIISFGTSSIGMNYDEGQWNYIGRAWLQKGVPPYAGAMENKNPGIYLLYGFSNILFGVNFWFPRILGIVSLTLCAVLVFKIVRYLHSHFAASLAMILFGFAITWKSIGGRLTAQTESFMILFILLSFYVMLKLKDQPNKNRYLAGLFTSGILMGIAIYFKQIAIISVLPLFGFYFMHTSKASSIQKRRMSDFLVILGGILCFTVIGLIPIILSKLSFMDYLKGAWLIFTKEGTPTSFPPKERFERFIHTFKETKLILFYPLLFAFVVQRSKLVKRDIPFSGILLWIATDVLSIMLSGIYSTYQLKLLLPSFSVASAIGLSTLLESDFISAKIRPAHYGQIILIIFILWVPIYLEPVAALKNALMASPQNDRSAELCGQPFSKPNENDRKQLGLWIKEITAEEDLVYIAGYGAPVQAYSERISPTRYFDGMFARLPQAADEIRGDLVSSPPKLILIPRFDAYKLWVTDHMKNMVEKIVDQGYSYKTCYYGYDIFERISSN